MDLQQVLRNRLRDGIHSTVLFDEPLSRHTSLRVGGPAWAWVWVKDSQDLLKMVAFAKEETLPICMVGGGYNVLSKQKGFDGVILNLKTPYFRRMEIEGKTTLCVGAGVSLEELVAFTRRKGLGGLEMMTGVPGTVGGAIAVNAGSHNRSIGDQIEKIVFLNSEREVVHLTKEEIHFEYRSSSLTDGFVLEAKLRVTPTDRETLDSQCREFMLYKKRTQDLVRPSAGCIFKNPKSLNQTSGELIDLSGLKGKRVGDAQVSEKHANFIVNLGRATSDDVFSLIDQVRGQVRKDHQCELELEVRVL